MAGPLVAALNRVLPIVAAIPDPISSSLGTALHQVVQAIEQTKDNRNQLQLLFLRVCDVLQSLRVPPNFADKSLQASSEALLSNLEDIRDYVVTERRKHFFRSMLRSDDVKLKIEELERNVWSSCLSFQNSALISANRKLDDLWNLVNKFDKEGTSHEALRAAQMKDQDEQLKRIHEALECLSRPEADTRPLDALLDVVNIDPVVTMTAMSALLERHETGRVQLRGEEISFLRAGLTRLREQSENAAKVKVKPWTVTGYEVERGFLIGADTSSMVRAGRWLGSSVGILELKDVPTVMKVVKMWKNLRSTRVQTFLAASTVDNPPFILLESFQSNIVDYVQNLSASAFGNVISEIIWGLEYLHSQVPPVVHGELRPATVNVGEKGNIFLTMTGIRADDLTLSSDQWDNIYLELRKWLAPEVIEDPTAERSTSSDIFSFGKLLLRLLEGRGNRAKERHQLLWDLAQDCTNTDPAARPGIAQVHSRVNDHYSGMEHTDMLITLPDASEFSAEQDSALMTVDKWRVVPFVTRAAIRATEHVDLAYLTTSPLCGKDERPLRKLGIEVKCHDQGRAATSARQCDGHWAWVELALSRKNAEGKWYEVDLEKALEGKPRGFMIDPKRYEIVRCPFADDTPRVHRVHLDHKNPFVQEARKGDRILLYPKARFPGWSIYMYSAEIHVVTEF